MLNTEICALSTEQMKHKGRLQEGMDADITVFNPETVRDNGLST